MFAVTNVGSPSFPFKFNSDADEIVGFKASLSISKADFGFNSIFEIASSSSRIIKSSSCFGEIIFGVSSAEITSSVAGIISEFVSSVISCSGFSNKFLTESGETFILKTRKIMIPKINVSSVPMVPI